MRSLFVNISVKLNGIEFEISQELDQLSEIPGFLHDVRAHGFEITCQPTASKKNPNGGSGDEQRYTPREITATARDMWGSIDLDPASTELANTRVEAARFFTREDDGLAQDWVANTVWLNAPYTRGAMAKWTDKLLSEYAAGNFREALTLTKNDPSTKWFKRLRHLPHLIFDERLAFWGAEHPKGQKGNAFTSALFYLGDEPHRFAAYFDRFGTIHNVDPHDAEPFSFSTGFAQEIGGG